MRIAICDDELCCRQQAVKAIDECIRSLDILTDVFETGAALLQAFQKCPYVLYSSILKCLKLMAFHLHESCAV